MRAAPTAPPDLDPQPLATADAPTTSEGPRCANCGTPAGDAFCPRCGQEQHDLHRSLRAVVGEVLDNLAGWDGKILATLRVLVRHPGELTTEFLAGRRVRYLRPLRLYLTLSLVYFLALSSDWGKQGRTLNVQMDGPAVAGGGSAAEQRVDSLARAQADSIAAARAARRAARRAERPVDAIARSSRVERLFEARVERFRRLPKAERNRAFTTAFFGQLPNMVFALVPVFALLLRAAYRRSRLFYAEHLVHALHLHAFAMLALLVVHVTPGAWSLLPFLALPAYTFVALRRVYGGSRRRTAAKLTLVLGGYTVALTAAVSLMALLILFFVVGG